MAYEPKTTSGGYPYLGGAGVFPQFSAGFRWVAETLEELGRSALRNEGALGTADLDTIGRGVWRQPFGANATEERHYPSGAGDGLLIAVAGEPDNEIRQIYFSDAGVWHRVRRAYKWLPWSSLGGDFKSRGSLGSAHLDTVTTPGIHAQQFSGNALPERNYPARGIGILEVWPLAPAGDVRQVWTVTSPWPGSSWHRRLAGGAWSSWERIGSGGGGSTPTPELTASGSPGMTAVRRTARVSAARKRLLGGYGTAGQGAVALRFDDGHADFKAKALPLLQKHGLPAYIAVTERLLAESGVTYAELQSWALNSGVEVTAHSRDHVDKSADADILSAVHTFGDDLEKAVGQVVVDTWTFPGGGDFGGLDAGRDPSKFAETYSGRLLLERYAVPHGGSAGYFQPLTGEPTVGQVHVTIEAYTLDQVQDMVRRAQSAGMGITLMMHPTKIDTEGFMSSATLDAVLGWIAGEREAGRLAVLTGTGMGFADASSSSRANMLADTEFASSGWTGTGWTFAGGVATATDIRASALSQDILINPFAGSRGAPVELSVQVQGAAGDTIKLSLTAGGGLTASRTVALPRTGWSRVYVPATIPTGVGLGTNLSVAIERLTSAGTVSVRAPRLSTI